MEANLWVIASKYAEYLWEVKDSTNIEHADTDRSHLQCVDPLRPLSEVMGECLDGSGMLKYGVSDVSQYSPAPFPVEELHTKSPLEISKSLRESRS